MSGPTFDGRCRICTHLNEAHNSDGCGCDNCDCIAPFGTAPPPLPVADPMSEPTPEDACVAIRIIGHGLHDVAKSQRKQVAEALATARAAGEAKWREDARTLAKVLAGRLDIFSDEAKAAYARVTEGGDE